MSITDWEAVSASFDAGVALLERYRTASPPDEIEDDSAEWEDLSDDEQRAEIMDHLQAHPEDVGLLGEAVNESSYDVKIREAFKAGDDAELGRLVRLAIFEYMPNCMPDWSKFK